MGVKGLAEGSILGVFGCFLTIIERKVSCSAASGMVRVRLHMASSFVSTLQCAPTKAYFLHHLPPAVGPVAFGTGCEVFAGKPTLATKTSTSQGWGTQLWGVIQILKNFGCAIRRYRMIDA